MAASAGRDAAAWVAAALIGLLALQGLSGCASPPPVAIPPGTWMLAEVMHVLTGEHVAADRIEPGGPPAQLRRALEVRGLTDDDVRRGRVFVLRTLIYWNNTVSGIKHDELRTEAAIEGLNLSPGNVVEMQLQPRGALITRVRAPNLAEGQCFYAEVGVGPAVEALGALSMVGPRGSASLYCKGIELEGWIRPRTYWHKPPGPAQPAPVGFVPPRPVAPAAAPPPLPSLAEQGLARVTVRLSDSRFGFLRELPVQVDDERVASLAEGQCTVFLLPEGKHRVTVGHDDRSLIVFQHARRLLDVEVRAGDMLVLEYLVDDDVLAKMSLDFFVDHDRWAERAYTFRQRAATPSDACALRGPARVVGRRAPPGNAP